MDCVLFLTSKIKNKKIENEKKFINVKLYGEKPSVVNAPSKKGAKYITNNLFSKKLVKLNLKSFFQIYSSLNNLYFLYGYILLNGEVHVSKLFQILN